MCQSGKPMTCASGNISVLFRVALFLTLDSLCVLLPRIPDTAHRDRADIPKYAVAQPSTLR